MTTLSERLKLVMAGPPRVSQADLARACGVKPPSVTDWLNGRTKRLEGENLLLAARKLSVTPEWLATGRGPMQAPNANASRYQVVDASAHLEIAVPIELLDVRGACGGGAINFADDDHRALLMKEPGWFRHYKIKPEDVLAVWADGDSMARFITDGDIVFFDRSKTTPKSGRIFLIGHPDGLRIKQLRREIDGAWVLESLNVDKARFPDERITEDHAELLKLYGEFVCRQG